MTAKVSIIIPAYNVEKFVESAIKSILYQSYDNLEVIIINDGSTDGTLSVLTKYADIDDRIKVVDQTNKGVSAARNRGLDISSGKYVYFFDADDFLKKDAILKLVKQMNQLNADIVTFDANIWANGKESSYITHKKLQSNSVYDRTMFLKKTKWNLTPVWVYFFNRDFLIKNKLRFKENVIFEDNLFYVGLTNKVKKIGYINEAFFLYKKRPDSITGNLHTLDYKVKSLLIIYKELIKLQKTGNVDSIFNKFLKYRKNVILSNIIMYRSNNSISQASKLIWSKHLMNRFMLLYLIKLFIKKYIIH